MENKGILYLIPCPISEHNNKSIASHTLDVVKSLKHFVVERTRTTRRWIALLDHPLNIDLINFYEIDSYDSNGDMKTIFFLLDQNISVGLVSEAGCPAIADPGHEMVKTAHKLGYRVQPLVGPNSIIMALMSSGFSGQSFSFHGYLPRKNPELRKKIKILNNVCVSTSETQIFMEAPYRNIFLIQNLLEVLPNSRMMCIARNICSNSENIKSQSIKNWKREDIFNYHKQPCIFLIGQ